MTTRAARRRARSRSSPIPSRRQSRGRRVRQALEGVLRRHHRRRRDLPRHARQRHRRAVHPRRRRQVGRRPEGQARQALRRGRRAPARSPSTTSPPRRRSRSSRPAAAASSTTSSGDAQRRRLRHRLGSARRCGTSPPSRWPRVPARRRRSTSARSRTTTGEFNLNGIVAKSARKLVVVNSNTGKLYRIKLGHDGDSIDAIDEITGATVPGGDGMLLDNGRLVVVQGDPAQLSFLKLRKDARRAKLRAHADERQAPRPVDGRPGEEALPRGERRLRHQHEAVHRRGPAAQGEGPRPRQGDGHDGHGHDVERGNAPAADWARGRRSSGYSYCSASSTFSREARRAGMTAAPTPGQHRDQREAEQRVHRERDRQVPLDHHEPGAAPCRRRGQARRRSAP